MKTNKEIIIEIVDKLDLKWPTSKRSKINREKLIECWSEYRKEADWNFYGHSSSATTCVSYSRIFKCIQKNTNEPWKAYILRLNGYKYCSKCNDLYTLNKYSKITKNINKLSSTCKKCDSIKNKKYCTENKNNESFRSAKYRASKLNRTPSWLTEDDLWMMQEAYSLAKEREKCTGIKWHVDHVIPLQGKLVSGLHVPTNLQVITAYDNMSKSNKFGI